MFRSFIILALTLLIGVFAHAVPAQLSTTDAQARVIVVKKFIILSGLAQSEEDISYQNLVTSVGKYGMDFGDFSFTGEIWESNQRRFICETSGINSTTKEFYIRVDQLDKNSKCVEAPFVNSK